MNHATRGFRALLAGAMTLALLAIPSGDAAAVPTQLTVQGQLKAGAGPAPDGLYALTISLYAAETGGTSVWQDVLADVPVTGGIFEVRLGAAGGNPLTAQVFINNPQVWMGVQVVDGPSISGPEPELPRQRMTTVGYAFVAARSITSGDLECTSGCVSEVELAFDPATQAELNAAIGNMDGIVTALQGQVTAAVSDIATINTTLTTVQSDISTLLSDVADLQADVAALQGNQITSVDGLGGGTITSGVTVQGDVAGNTITQNGNVVCDESGNCGQTLANLACQTDEIIKFDGTAWACAPIGSAGGPPKCDGLHQALQYDGSDWQCVDTRKTGLSVGEANGYEVVDNWNYAWDGIQRAPKPWAEAKADCEAEGGRLPTITELWRNNASSTGTGNIATPNDGSYLWTLIADYQDPYRVSVRLSDGSITYYHEVNQPQAYRCVWPDRNSDVFDGNYCFGPPGAECKGHGFVWNVDKMDRPEVHFAAAVNECAFYNASVTDQQDFSELAQAGWDNPSNDWLWMNESTYWYSGNYGHALGRWSNVPEPYWGYDPNSPHGTIAGDGNNHRFRCIGKRDAGLGTLPSDPACMNGNCFSMTDSRRAHIIADNEDRVAATQQDAQTTCRLLGGSLPTSAEMIELIHAGWENGTNNWLWSSESTYWYNGNYGWTLIRFTTESVRFHITGSSMGLSGAGSPRAYRCVWHETFEDPAEAITTCAADENQVWDGSSFSCEASDDGDSGGNANPVQAVDGWGNAWDLIQRGNQDFATAKATCEGLGGRLPTATELYRVRNQSSPLDITIADSTSTSYLWTLNPERRGNYQTTLRMSDGAASSQVVTNTMPFRCVWPSTKGDAFTGRACHGEVDDPCYQVGRMRIDRYDRAAIQAAGAIWECSFYGGRLADTRDFQLMVHMGAPNGSNNWNWISRPNYWYNGGYGYSIGRWSGVGNTSWGFESSTYGGVSDESNNRNFRCVFGDAMR